MQMTLDGEARLSDLPPALFRELTEELTVTNPAWQNAVRLGRPTFGISKTLRLYEVRQNELILPRGMAVGVWRRRPKGSTCKDETVTLPPVAFDRNTIALRDYQQKALDAVLKSRLPQGVILAPCSSGKTEIGLALAARIGQPTIWITHTEDLLEQTIVRARTRLGLGAGEIGMIGAGVCRPGSHLTVAMVQTLYRTELAELGRRFGLVLVDECHRVVNNPEKASMFCRVLACLPAHYRYGLTASEQRADGLTQTIWQVLGDPICRINRQELEEAGNLVNPTVQPLQTPFLYEPAPGEERINYSRFLKQLAANRQRMQFAAQLAAGQLSRGRVLLVLGQSLAMLAQLEGMLLQAGYDARYIHSGNRRSVRAESIRAVREGRASCLLATYQLAKEGLDIPRLDTLLMLTPVRDSVTVQQSVGRIMRPAPGKWDALVLDLVDDQVPVCRGQFAARKREYKQLGVEIKPIDTYKKGKGE